jgi:hypothetical protein
MAVEKSPEPETYYSEKRSGASMGIFFQSYDRIIVFLPQN